MFDSEENFAHRRKVRLRERVDSSKYDSGLDGWWAGRVDGVLAFVEGIAKRDCEAREFYEESGKDEKCLDPEYNETTGDGEGTALKRCDPCAARAALGHLADRDA